MGAHAKQACRYTAARRTLPLKPRPQMSYFTHIAVVPLLPPLHLKTKPKNTYLVNLIVVSSDESSNVRAWNRHRRM